MRIIGLLCIFWSCSAPPSADPPNVPTEIPAVSDRVTPEPPAVPAIVAAAKPKSLERDGIRFGSLEVKPATHFDAVNAILPITIDKLAYCARKAHRTEPRLHGSVLFAFELTRNGVSSPPRVLKQTIDNKSLEGCLISRLMKISPLKNVDNASIQLPVYIQPNETQETR